LALCILFTLLSPILTRRIIGSISNWRLHGLFDTKTNRGTEIGEISFGVHQSHKDHSVTYHGQITSVNPNTRDHRREDYAGWMKITGMTEGWCLVCLVCLFGLFDLYGLFWFWNWLWNWLWN
jgi:hypothetical protein